MNNAPLKVDIASQPTLKCEKCDNPFFKKVTVIKKISKILTASSEDQFVPMEIYACDSCSHINDEFNVLKYDEK